MEEPKGRFQGASPFAALRSRDFRIFWIGSVLSGIGSQFSSVAMAWQIYELTDSAFQIGLLGLARAAADHPSPFRGGRARLF